mmetsp:Transcript_39328/g.92720  ORF Transcript_39328/g.92720 Transcript_39328/m.92720 type:complete len:220 (+) Transcript_39328:764-1423(+)
MERVSSITNTVCAAFSKSVRFSSMLRNSTRHEMLSCCAGGTLNRTVFQLVDCRFSKWSFCTVLSCSSFSEKTTRGSRMKRCATWVARRSSMPSERSLALAASSTTQGTSLNLSWLRHDVEMKQSIDEYLDFGIARCPSWRGARPRSAGGRSSTEAEMTSQRTSVSARRPFQMGAAAVSASMYGAMIASWSYRNRAAHTSWAWKVIWRQPAPMPKAMQSI